MKHFNIMGKERSYNTFGKRNLIAIIYRWGRNRSNPKLRWWPHYITAHLNVVERSVIPSCSNIFFINIE